MAQHDEELIRDLLQFNDRNYNHGYSEVSSLKIFKMHDYCIVPNRGINRSWTLYSTGAGGYIIRSGRCIRVATGIALEIPRDHILWMPQGRIGGTCLIVKNLTLSESDAGEIHVLVENDGEDEFFMPAFTRLGLFWILRVPKIDSLIFE